MRRHRDWLPLRAEPLAALPVAPSGLYWRFSSSRVPLVGGPPLREHRFRGRQCRALFVALQGDEKLALLDLLAVVEVDFGNLVGNIGRNGNALIGEGRAQRLDPVDKTDRRRQARR